MKNINKIIQKILLVSVLLIGFIANAQTFTPINVNTTAVTDSCTNVGDFTISIPSEVLSGENIPLNISLPPTGCPIDINISYSSPNNKIEYVLPTSLYDFSDTGNTTTNDNPISVVGGDGINFNIFYKFPNYITCNGEIATFTVTFTSCNTTCTATVSTTARAANYWTIEKNFVRGNMVCGISDWSFKVKNNNPNPSGFGGYKIQGTITENPTSPYTVVGNSVFSITGNKYGVNIPASLNNCGNIGDVITNTASYNFTLGDGCETMSNTVTATSPSLEEPRPSLNFTKNISPFGGISPGCQGKYRISISNNGNVPLQINSVTDSIPTSDITITNVIVPTGFVNNNLISDTDFIFTTLANSPIILDPGEHTSIYFNFTVNSDAIIGSTISNTAYIEYNAIGTSSTNNSNTTINCPSINCPPVDEGVLNDNNTANFTVVAPSAKEVFYKCVTNQPAGNIYNLGDAVHFKYILGSGGAGNLTTNITDYLGLQSQNLQILPGSITYTYYEHKPLYRDYSNCNDNFTNPQPITFDVTSNTTNLQNPIFNISNMPGTCDYGYGNFLIIEFDAEVLLQVYGNKVNTAYTNTNQSSASYTIDQFGVLSVDKRADKEFVENGESFNYIIEVTNNGSVPLDNVSISDQIPSCVQLGELIDAKDFAGDSININLGGTPSALQISLPSTWQLMPGQTATFTIQATKTGEGTCCNESVTASGTMITSGVVLDAIDGSASEPAACVKSTKCCDIQDFEASLYENADGSYSVEINGGAVPIQQVDIAVIDYHLEYSQRDCQPQDMGNFGQLSTNRPLLNGLTFETNTNNTSNLTWLPGNPDVMNTSVNFYITKPNVLDLECCDVDFYFCIKVTVKDVNCNVCEKVICPEPYVEPEPCAISVKDVNTEYCTNDTINISWSGANSSGNVNVYLVTDNGGSPIQIAYNQPETGSLNWSIPAFTNEKECDINWKIVVVDPSNEGCVDVTNTFLIKCCEKKCECGDWKTNAVRIEQKIMVDLYYEISKEKKHTKNPILEPFGQYEIRCGGALELKKGTYQITSPMYGCEGDCRATYRWILKDLSTGQVTHGVGNTFNHNFNYSGKFKLFFIPECGGNECGGCEIIIAID